MDTAVAFNKYFELKDATEGGILLRREQAEVEVIQEQLWHAIAALNARGEPDVYPYFFVDKDDSNPLLSEDRLLEVAKLASRLSRLEYLRLSPFQESTFYFPASQMFLASHIARKLDLVIVSAGKYRLVTDKFSIDCSPGARHRFVADGARFIP
ncbi:hypothetical protein CWC48_29945 [Pseudomonas sp. S10E 269]|uniref:hypothetical protein n=1 Tax=unclassified Pseudomonas TaxID=196821 RepID=UPI000C25AD8C|nr:MULTISPECIES: hypothetical protein [unclassified Pseudomonas]PJK31765.1 hypothetical protein CWC49_29910 [Pseudomonas sp. S09F 262]PJK37553.1 hypothetical protein CWC48_29945 [Pseudomonas sp. S10E 269]